MYLIVKTLAMNNFGKFVERFFTKFSVKHVIMYVMYVVNVCTKKALKYLKCF